MVRPVESPGEPVELELEGRVVDLCRRRELRSEKANADPPETAERAEAAAVTAGDLHCRVPVRGDAELARAQPPPAIAGDEDNGDAFELLRAALEEALRGAGRHAAYVDAVDADAVGDPPWGAGESKPEH
jgi:hypothetical protein